MAVDEQRMYTAGPWFRERCSFLAIGSIKACIPFVNCLRTYLILIFALAGCAANQSNSLYSNYKALSPQSNADLTATPQIEYTSTNGENPYNIPNGHKIHPSLTGRVISPFCFSKLSSTKKQLIGHSELLSSTELPSEYFNNFIKSKGATEYVQEHSENINSFPHGASTFHHYRIYLLK